MLSTGRNHQQQQHHHNHREEAARAVLRDALHRGYTCVELRRDGKRPIFFCSTCQIRCYNDPSLWDHLHGNLHARHASGNNQQLVVKPEKPSVDRFLPKHEKMQLDTKPPPRIPLGLAPSPELQLRLIDQGQMFVKVRPCSGAQLLEACWLEKRVLVKSMLHHHHQQLQQQSLSREVEYGILVFPYSEGLGRGATSGGDGHGNVATTKVDVKEVVEPQKTRSGGNRGRKRTAPMERVCFICRQRMLPGKDVATLLNVVNKQMMCHSRNWLGAFHVYHTGCLINWVLIFDAKFWMGHSLNFSRSYRKNLMSSGLLSSKLQEKPIFCPECQGTGFRFSNGLEPPRYRLAQIFDWVLELVQARKLWIDRLGQELTGLMFHASKGVSHPREFESSLVVPRGSLRFYYTELNSKLTGMKSGCDGSTNMEIDI